MGPWQLLPHFEGEHLEQMRTSQLAPLSPKGSLVGSHCWLTISGFPEYPHMIGWIIDGKVHQKSSVKIVTYWNTILALGGLILEFPWDLR